jgi:hypothetical protein
MNPRFAVAALVVSILVVPLCSRAGWRFDGTAVSTALYSQSSPMIVSDGSGGTIIVWTDSRSGAGDDIYVQRFDASGDPRWAADGVAVCTAANSQYFPMITSDGMGGAVVTCHDGRNDLLQDIYVQRIDASGAAQWQDDGVFLCSAAGSPTEPVVVSDGSGGVVVVWTDLRVPYADLYAQRVDANGAVFRTADGVPVSTASDPQQNPAIAPDGTGGAVVTWQDERSGSDVYAQRIEPRYGRWGRPEPIVTSVGDVPGDQGGRVKVNWTASGHDRLILQTISHYSIWRATDPVTAASAVTRDPGLLVRPRDIDLGFTRPAYRVERHERPLC